MGTVLTDKTNETTGIDATISAVREASAIAAGAARPRRTRRLGYVVGAVVATAAAAAILVSTALPTLAPKATRPTTLPPMSASMGFWDFVSYPKPALPPMSNSMGFWDFVSYPATSGQ